MKALKQVMRLGTLSLCTCCTMSSLWGVIFVLCGVVCATGVRESMKAILRLISWLENVWYQDETHDGGHGHGRRKAPIGSHL